VKHWCAACVPGINGIVGGCATLRCPTWQAEQASGGSLLCTCERVLQELMVRAGQHSVTAALARRLELLPGSLDALEELQNMPARPISGQQVSHAAHLIMRCCNVFVRPCTTSVRFCVPRADCDDKGLLSVARSETAFLRPCRAPVHPGRPCVGQAVPLGRSPSWSGRHTRLPSCHCLTTSVCGTVAAAAQGAASTLDDRGPAPADAGCLADWPHLFGAPRLPTF